MADKRLNDVSTASDGAYVYAEDASGNQIKISKADLATVVAGLLGIHISTHSVENGATINITMGYGLLVVKNISAGKTSLYKIQAGYTELIHGSENDIQVARVGEFEISITNNSGNRIALWITMI